MSSSALQLSSLKRGLRALSLLNARGALSASELAAELQLPRTTARRVLDTLVGEGYAEKVSGEHHYRLTPMVGMLSSGFSDESWIAHVAHPMLVHATRDIGWPLSIATPAADQMMVRVSTDRLTPLAMDHFGVGFKTPMLHGTSGHVMLAFMSSKQRELTLEVLRHSRDPKQQLAKDDARIAAMLRTVRERGYAHIVYSEYPEASLGVPVFLNNAARACLLITYLKVAIKPVVVVEQYLPLLKDLSARITAGVCELRAVKREPSRRSAAAPAPISTPRP